MKIVKAYLFVIFILSLVIGPGCSDNGSDSNDEIPADLVDTWWLQSATINGDPIDEMHIYCHMEEWITFLSLTLNSDGTWDAIGYRENMTVIGTETGTFTIDGNSISILMTACDGVPIDDPENGAMTAQFTINGDILTITVTEDDPYIGEIVVVQVYLRE